MDELSKRMGLALRKFLAFEKASGRHSLFEGYRLALHSALRGESLSYVKHDKEAIRRLKRAGFLTVLYKPNINAKGVRTLVATHRFAAVPGSSNVSEADSKSDKWLTRHFNAVEVCRFYAMETHGIEWILEDLQARYVSVGQGEQGFATFQKHVLGHNILVLSGIWRVNLYWQLTQIGEEPELDIWDELGAMASGERRVAKAVAKEKLGLSKMPDYYQMVRIKATSAYMRSGVVG